MLMGSFEQKRPRFLCLHGFRTSGEILKKQVGKWPDSLCQKLDLVFIDAPFPAQGNSNVEGIFDPPFFEWYQANQDLTYENFEQCLDYIEDCMIKQGPFDGLLGFSQGAFLAGALPGLQAQGLALKKVPQIKCLIIISGAKISDKSWADKAYASLVQCPSVHFIGKEDFLRDHGEELLKCFIDPLIVHHPKGHTIPRLDDQSLPIMLSFLDKIQKSTEENVMIQNGLEPHPQRRKREPTL